MAHDRVPRVLYEHPVVEYIPLEVRGLARGSLPAAVRAGPASLYPALHALPSPEDWFRAAAAYPFAFPGTLAFPLTDPADGGGGRARSRPELPLLGLGFQVDAGIYRGSKVSLAAFALGPYYHLFSVPRKYFYKPTVDFVVYSLSGAKVAEARAVPVGALGLHPRPE